MFKVVTGQKTEIVEIPMISLQQEQGNIFKNVVNLWMGLERVQTDRDKDPTNFILKEQESIYLHAYTVALKRFLQEKTKGRKLISFEKRIGIQPTTIRNRIGVRDDHVWLKKSVPC